MGARLMTEMELSNMLNVKPATIRQWRARGTGPPYLRINSRLIRYDRQVIEAWLERARLAAEVQMARSRLVRPEVVEEAINQAVDKMIHDISFVQKLDDTIGAVDMTPEEKYEMYREMVLGTHHDTLAAEDEGEYIGGTDVQQYIFTMKRQIFKELTAKGGKIQGWDKSIKITGSIESPTNPKGNVITLPNSARPQMRKLHRKTSFHFHR